MATVVYPGGHFTHCVDPAHFHLPAPFYLSGPASAGKEACDFLLGGKLVCMSPDAVCAIGTVVGLEGTATANPASTPSTTTSRSTCCSRRMRRATSAPGRRCPAVRQHNIAKDVAAHARRNSCVDNVAATSPLPTPREPKGPPAGTSPVGRLRGALHVGRLGAHYDHERARTTSTSSGRSIRAGDASAISIPILHCECEGSRIWAVCNAMAPFLDVLSGKPPGAPGPSVSEVCHATLGWIPFVGDFLCALAEAIVDIAMFPIVLAMAAAAAIAWAAAQAYDDLFLTGPVKERIRQDQVVVRPGPVGLGLRPCRPHGAPSGRRDRDRGRRPDGRQRPRRTARPCRDGTGEGSRGSLVPAPQPGAAAGRPTDAPRRTPGARRRAVLRPASGRPGAATP